MNPERARRRRVRRRILFGVGGLLILAATLMGGLSLLFPWVLAHPERVQQFLSDRLHRPVNFATLDGEWLPGGPVFRISDLRIGGDTGHPALEVERAELVVDFYAPFKRDVPWHELRIIGLAIDAERDADGRFRIVQWRGSADTVGDPLDALRALGAFRVSQSVLSFHDVGSDSRIRLGDIDVAIGARVGGQRIVGRAKLGDAAPIDVRCDLAADFRSGQCYAQAQALPVAQALGDLRVAGIGFAGGAADLSVWAKFLRSEITDGRIELAADALALRGMRPVRLSNGEEIEARYSPDATRLALQWTRNAEREQFSLLEGPTLDQDDPARSKLSLQRERGNGAWTLAVEHLELDRLMPWLSLSTLASPGTAGWLFEAAPIGHLREFSMSGKDSDVADIAGELKDVALSSTRRSPRVAGIDADVRGDAEAVVIQVEPVETVIDFPGVFPAPFPVHIERAQLVLVREGDGVRVEFPELALQGEDFGLDGWLALVFERDGKRPFIDAAVNVRDSGIVAAKAFWPIVVMPANTRGWLDRALVSGRITRGVASIRGDLDDWPFNADQGRFMADAEIVDLVLDYHRDWPRGQVHQVETRFRNGGMTAVARDGRILDVAIAQVEGDLESFKDPILRLRGSAEGAGPALLEFLRATPLNQRYRDELLALSIGGRGDANFDLRLPLALRLGEPTLEGRVDLHDADLADAKWGLKFEQANGIVRFSRDGFDAEGLDVRVDGDAARFAIAVGAHAADPAHQLEASLRGDMKAPSVMSAFHVLDPYWNRLPGKAYWDLSLVVPRSPDPERPALSMLTLNSDLRGITLDLPAPLGKDAESPMPLRMSVQLPAAGHELDVQIGAMARFKARMADDQREFAGHLALGGELPVLPARPGLRISGSAPSIDLGGWSAFGVGGSDASPDLSVDLQANELEVMGRGFADTSLRIERDARVTRVDLEGVGIDGSFEVPRAELATRGLTLQFEKLHWPEADVAGQRSSRPTDPSQLPPLHIWVRDLKLGAASFGEARVETQPMPGGLRIEQFDARSPTLTMRASGDWKLVDGSERSGLDITLSSESLGKMLESLGYAGVIDGGQTVARIKGNWAGSPAQFGLVNIDGELSGEVGEGRILNVDPGAGRIFGLVNFSAIPRRLSLDFRDFFQTGMAFDSIRGSFTLVDGSAHTANLEIKGPAADIRISGRTGLRAKDYEQDMEVTPKLRGALPIVGAVAGGPVGAVVGVLAQEVMRKPIDEVVSSRYRVRGTWDKPDITLIGKMSRRQAAEDGSG
ncbi:MAG: TIGR02099 family protein [Xanthomonadales bacterium]|nr:TIGR02099 family protein [Xanthomonadales bacterium]MBP6077515.1 TIGR02099 family protein [Xanthomonadales bacterium]